MSPSPPSFRAASLALVLATLLAACHIEKRTESGAGAGGGDAPPPGGQFANKTFDAKAQVVDIWDSKVLPALQAEAAPDFATLRSAMKADLDAAGAKYGHRSKAEGAPWNFVTHLQGKIITADTELSAATMEVDVDGDGQADATVQIGPILRGTSLRDALPFISFTNYANQVEFAQLANAFNDQAFAKALKAMPREKLVGQQIALLGVFTVEDPADAPVITPVQLKLGKP